ncbi:MAG TPA: hypothetical protein VD833_03030 [Vicinamibacterales bacterium]|nr:hypothetical protein [Vicinamibacterales bacterium]
MYTRPAAAALTLAAGIGVGLLAQETQRFPGPTTGIVRVAGSVDVGNTPTVLARQSGEWKIGLAGPPDVRVTNVPTVSIATPDFLRAGSRWRLTWAGGNSEVVEIVRTSPGGWVQVGAGGRVRWINLATVQSADGAP